MHPIFIVLTQISNKPMRVNVSNITTYEDRNGCTLISQTNNLLIEVLESVDMIDKQISNAIVDDRRA